MNYEVNHMMLLHFLHSDEQWLPKRMLFFALDTPDRDIPRKEEAGAADESKGERDEELKAADKAELAEGTETEEGIETDPAELTRKALDLSERQGSELMELLTSPVNPETAPKIAKAQLEAESVLEGFGDQVGGKLQADVKDSRHQVLTEVDETLKAGQE